MQEASMLIRDAKSADLPAILGIYDDVIANTAAIYTDDLVDLAERRAWWRSRRAAALPVLVAEEADAVIGFSSFGAWRAPPGFAATVEHSVHVRADRRGRGVGAKLLAPLIDLATARGMHAMVGGIGSENAASIVLHRRHGFEQAARYREVARKFGRWRDLVEMQRML